MIDINIKKYLLLILFAFSWLISPSPVRAAESVVLQLRWDPQFQFAGYYAALWKGYYADVGIDVEIRPAWYTDKKLLSATKEVAEGRADFGVGAGDILTARDGGVPLVLLAAFFQRSPVEIYVRKDTNYKSLADLTTMKVFRNINDMPDVELQAMLRAEGIDPRMVEPVTGISYFEAVNKFNKGEIEAFMGYSIASPFLIQDELPNTYVLRAENYGIAFYGDSLFTHQRLIDKDPELVERFTEASKKGWMYALEHIEEIAAELSKETLRIASPPDLLAYNLFQAKGIRELMLYPNVDIGNIHPARWQKMHQYLEDAKLVTGALNLDDFIFNPEHRKTLFLEKILEIGAIIGLIVIALLVVFYVVNRSLRGEVNRRTSLLVKSEQKYKHLIENQALMTGQFLPDSTIIYANKLYADNFGENVDQIIGQKFSKYMSVDEADEVLSYLAKFTPDTAVQNREVAFVGSDGKDHWHLWNTQAFFGENNNIDYYQAYGTDITKTKQLEQQLTHIKKMDIVGQLTGGIAHDFNNLLQIIQTNLDLANRKLDKNSPLRDLLDPAINAGKRGRNLIQQLMAFSRKQALSRELVNPNDQIIETIQLLDRTITANIQITTDLTIGVSPIFVDLNNFQNALLNLAVNAREAMQSGGVLTISSRMNSYAGTTVIKGLEISVGKFIEISVTDTGCGMTEEVLEKATEPYFTTREAGKGSGLGLSTVYGFARESNGAVEIMSEIDKGTTVTMILPVAENFSN